jgi:hypothetical protein
MRLPNSFDEIFARQQFTVKLKVMSFIHSKFIYQSFYNTCPYEGLNLKKDNFQKSPVFSIAAPMPNNYALPARATCD